MIALILTIVRFNCNEWVTGFDDFRKQFVETGVRLKSLGVGGL